MTISLLHLEICLYEEEHLFKEDISTVFPYLTDEQIAELHFLIFTSVSYDDLDNIKNKNYDNLIPFINDILRYINLNF